MMFLSFNATRLVLRVSKNGVGVDEDMISFFGPSLECSPQSHPDQAQGNGRDS